VGNATRDVMASVSPESATYEAPAVRVLGGVEEFTQVRWKDFGPTDGYEYQGNPIADVST
jgi:hypothetical protein